MMSIQSRLRLILNIRLACAAVVAIVLPEPSSAGDKPNVHVRFLSGKHAKGEFLGLNGGKLVIREKTSKSFPIDDILRVDCPISSRSSAGPSPVVYLANGDRLVAHAEKTAGDNLHVKVSRQATFKLPLSSIRAILLQRPETSLAAAKLQAVLLNHTARKDLLVLRNGDRILGRLKSLDENAVSMSGTTGKISRKNVAAIAFDRRYIESPKMPPRRWLVQLQDGSRLTARAVNFKNGTLRIELLNGTTYKVLGELLLSLQRISPRMRPLSALSPTDYEHTPFLSGKRKLRINRNTLDHDLSLRGRKYTIGLGMHSKSRASFAVPKDARHFLATIGIDDAARGRGNAVFAIEVDGKRVFTSKALTGKDKPVAVGPISLAGAKRLTLIVEFGPFGDILDYADWCDAVIVKR